MKCSNCGANLNIEDKVCPYCGLPNPFAVEHQKEMEHFEKEFEETRTEVISKSENVGRRAGRMTVIAIMVALCAVMLVLIIKVDDLYYWKLERQHKANDAQITAEVEQLMAEDRYSELKEYMNSHRLLWSDVFDEYENVYYASSDYSYLYNYINMLICKDEMSYEYYTKEELIENISRQLHSLYRDVTPDKYSNKEYFSADKKTYMNGVVKQAELLIQFTFGLSDEELRGMPQMSQSRLSVLLEDSYDKKKDK